MKITSSIVSKLRSGKVVFIHTKANKIAGLLLFIGMLFVKTACFQYVVIVIIVVAMFAAVDETIKVARNIFQ